MYELNALISFISEISERKIWLRGSEYFTNQFYPVHAVLFCIV